MLIAFLVLLGVNLIVVVGVGALLLSRRRWVTHRPGAFFGAIRVTSGDVDGFSPKWKRGYGRWVGDVLVWTKAPMFFRNELVPVDRIASERSAPRDEVKRLGDDAVVLGLECGKDRIAVATRGEHRALAVGAMSTRGAKDAGNRALGSPGLSPG